MALIACIAAVPAVSEDLSFNAYLDAYLAAFADIADAKEMYKEATLAYEGAVARNASVIELEILLSSRERKALDIRDITNQAALDACTLYSQYHEYSNAIKLAEARSDVARESMKNDESQFALGLISETDYLTKKLNLQTVLASVMTNTRKLEDVQRKMMRVLGSTPVFLQPPELDASSILASLAPVPLETALNGNALVYTAKATLSINEKIWNVISTSAYANDLEKKDAAEKFKEAKKAYRKALETLEDTCIETGRTIADFSSQMERYGISGRLSDISSESASLRKTYGKATELELAAVRNERQAKSDEMNQFTWKLVLKKLEHLKLANSDCSAWLREVMK
jgi:hypothetical protein